MSTGTQTHAQIEVESRTPWRTAGPDEPAGRAINLPNLMMVAIGFGTILAAPVAPVSGPVYPGLTAFFCGFMLVADLATAYLLLGAFRETRRPSILALAAAYAFSGAMALPYLATFPGAIADDVALLGSSQSAAWIGSAWLLGFGGLTLAALVLEAEPGVRPIPAALAGRFAMSAGTWVAAAVASISFAALAIPDTMFALIDNAHWTALYRLANSAATALYACAIGYGLVRLPRSSEMFAWLLVALTVAAAANVLAGIGGGRFTIGWLMARFIAVAGACVMLGFFLRQASRHHAALALARDRLERDFTMRTAQFTHMVAERDHLLSEVYHRVKNNLQMIDSLIHVQTTHIEAESARAALADMRRRIQTLALVHQEILAAGARDRIDAAALLADVCGRLGGATLTISAPTPEIVLAAEHATPLALIAAELLARASEAAPKHAVRAHLAAGGPGAILTIETPAVENDPWDALEGPNARGQIVRALTMQIGGGIARAAPYAIALSFPALAA